MRVGVLGTGLMGAPMAARLCGAGHAVTVWNRTCARAEPLRAAGAEVAATPGAAVTAADWVITMLADAAAIGATLLDPAVLPLLRGRTVVQMGTIGPDESRAIRDRVVAAGGEYLEAPVLGTTAEAQAGTLLVMAGADPDLFARARPLLACLGSTVTRVGNVGQAATLKLALNQLIASLNAAFALSLGLVGRAGLSADDFMALLRTTPLYAPAFDRKLPRMLARRYDDPNFPVKHMLKDVRLIRDTAERWGLGTAALAGVERILEAAVAAGLGEGDYCALREIVDPPVGDDRG